MSPPIAFSRQYERVDISFSKEALAGANPHKVAKEDKSRYKNKELDAMRQRPLITRQQQFEDSNRLSSISDPMVKEYFAAMKDPEEKDEQYYAGVEDGVSVLTALTWTIAVMPYTTKQDIQFSMMRIQGQSEMVNLTMHINALYGAVMTPTNPHTSDIR